jgi:hypothetical protein
MTGIFYSTLLKYTFYLLNTKFCKLQKLNESRVFTNWSLCVGSDQCIVDTNVCLVPVTVEPTEDVFLLKIFQLFGLRNFPTAQKSTTEMEQILMVVHI